MSANPKGALARDDSPVLSDGELVNALAALSLSTDLANGNPFETALKTGLSAVALAREAGVSEETCADVFDTSLVRFLGCTAYGPEEAAALGGDDIAARNLFAPLDSARRRDYLVPTLTRLGKGQGARRRAKAVANVLVRGQTLYARMAQTNCEVAERLAKRLNMAPAVSRALGHLFERWDGRGAPKGRKGEDIHFVARVLQVAHQAELLHRHHGADEARSVLKRRRGTQLDPKLVEQFLAHARRHFAWYEQPSVWDEVLAARPKRPRTPVSLATVCSAFADFVDLKSVFTLGHSAAVAATCESVGAALGCAVEPLRWAGFLHNLGRVSVPSGIWDKRGALTLSEWERVRLHPYLAERLLARSALLQPVASIVGAHAERLDGSGFHRGLKANAIELPARIVGAASVFHALREDRPHRPAKSVEAAAAELSAAAGAKLDRSVVSALLELSGQRARTLPSSWPAGLTDREVEVLRLLARGLSNKEIALALDISPKTVQHHVQHVYDKCSLSTRAGAALFAVEEGLL